MEWQSDYYILRLRRTEWEQINHAFLLLKKLDESCDEQIEVGRQLLREFDKTIQSKMDDLQNEESQRIYWEREWRDVGHRAMENWVVLAKEYQGNLPAFYHGKDQFISALWERISDFFKLLVGSLNGRDWQLTWRSNQEKKSWELWHKREIIKKISCNKIFVDYYLDHDVEYYWNEVFGLESVDKMKRFEKVQRHIDDGASPEIYLIDELLPLKMFNQIKELSDGGKILYYSQDWATGTAVMGLLHQAGVKACNWSEFVRLDDQDDAQVVFLWDRDISCESLMKNLQVSFKTLVVDKIPDISWQNWAQRVWQERSKHLAMSRFEGYWFRRATLFREKFLPIVKSLEIKVVYIDDAKKQKWKRESWEMLKKNILFNRQ